MRCQWIGSRAAGRIWCAGGSWPSCTEEGRRSAATRFKLGAAASKSTLRFVEDASRPGGSATASRSPAAGGSAASAQGLFGDSGGCDAAGAAAAELAARHSRRRWREFPVESAARGWCCSLDRQSGEWGDADGSAGLAPAASCFAARGCLYGAFVVAGAAPDRRQLPLSGGELTLDAGNTLTLRPPNSNLKPRSPASALTLMNMARDARRSSSAAALSAVSAIDDTPQPVAARSATPKFAT